MQLQSELWAGDSGLQTKIQSVNNCWADVFQVITAGIQAVETADCWHRPSVFFFGYYFEKGHLYTLWQTNREWILDILLRKGNGGTEDIYVFKNGVHIKQSSLCVMLSSSWITGQHLDILFQAKRQLRGLK